MSLRCQFSIFLDAYWMPNIKRAETKRTSTRFDASAKKRLFSRANGGLMNSRLEVQLDGCTHRTPASALRRSRGANWACNQQRDDVVPVTGTGVGSTGLAFQQTGRGERIRTLQRGFPQRPAAVAPRLRRLLWRAANGKEPRARCRATRCRRGLESVSRS